MSTPVIVLRLSDVVKTYPGVVALKGVSLEVSEGEVHAVVGENGAGKSTLMAVAAGATLPDEGVVEIGGHVMSEPSPAAAQALGLAVVYQHTYILEDLTVTENMIFAMPPAKRPRMSDAGAWVRERLLAVGTTTDPEQRASSLSPAERQLVEIAMALALESRVLVLDEPTESLNQAESELLFERIAEMKRGGTAVVYISHRLPEIKRIADRVTVLRDGEGRGTFDVASVATDDILRLIVGRAISQVFPAKRTPPETEPGPLLKVDNLSGARFHDVSLAVAPGEIVGLAGVEGNGQRELLRALAGLLPARGRVEVTGRAVAPGDPRRSRHAGVTHLPGDRHAEGVFLSLSVRENVGLLALPRAARAGFVRRRAETAIVDPAVERFNVRTPSIEAPVSTLSGGNQQKVLVARSMAAEPAVLLADEPTRGVDVGARVEIYSILREAADSGRAVLINSSDAIELEGMCDRVLVFSRGEVVRELTGADVTEANITGAAITAGTLREGAEPVTRRLAALRTAASGDYAPSVILAVLILALGAFTALQNPAFVGERSLISMLLLAAALIFVSIGQQVVVLVAGLDLSVGPLIGIVVIVLSSFVGEGAGTGQVALGVFIAVLTGVGIGLVNGLLTRRARLAPVLATLATSIVLTGIALWLRPTQSGRIEPGFIDAVKATVGPIPLAFVVAVTIAVVGEWVLRRTHVGIELRAVGSNELRAHRLGARITPVHLGAYVLCSLGAVLAGVMLAAQVGIGQAGLGAASTLSSITAVVLGGASIYGGRGSFIGAFAGALLLQEIITSTSFLSFGRAWQFWLPGVLILAAAAAFARVRRSGVGA
jgi:ribose transport system ATP-binding protein